MTDAALDPRVSGALTRYRIMAIITGTFLIAVLAGWLLKVAGVIVEGSTLAAITGYIAMAHGFIYMVYLAVTIHLWLLMHWGLGRLVMMGLGGIVPFLSFFLEHRFAVEIKGERAGSLEA